MVFGKKRKLVLVLSGGSARGLSHIGVLEVLEKHHVPIEAIVGTSMGALVGGLYAAGNLKNFKEEMLKLSENKLLALFVRNRLRKGKTKSDTIENFIKQFTSNKKIENLDIPFTSVATNLKDGKEVFIEKGSLLKAIVASISIPGIFPPVKYGGKMLVDGGVVDPLPQKYGESIGEKVIAVNAIPIKFKYKKEGDVFDIISEAVGLMTRQLIQLSVKEEVNSVFIQVKTGDISPFDFTNVGKIIGRGRKATQRNIAKIIELVKDI
jgi:NTE family protein